MLKVSNIRLGFANNSSSTHSILLCNSAKHKLRDRLVKAIDKDDEPNFGWDNFICASPEAKAKYFACQLADVLRPEVGEEVAGLTIAALFGLPEKYGKGGVDHQSLINLPRYSDGKIAIAFIRELFQEAIANPRVIIGGGNDNSDGFVPNVDSSEHPWFAALGTDIQAPVVVRPEPYGWCLFNKETGARVRLTREDATNMLPGTPELVDLCITKQCFKECPFCYQDCSYKGEHAKTGWIEHLAWGLESKNVFEVVLGGGEPTRHPDFLKILKAFREHNIVPNFTTADIGWMRNRDFVAQVVAYAGSIAFSCNDIHEMKYFARLILGAGEALTSKAVLQSIVGIVKPKDFKEMLKLAETFGFHKYSLVGFKQTGRAPQQMPYAIEQYKLPSLVKNSSLQFYVDTALLNLCPEIVEQYTCDTVEGRHSMYIDAVGKTMHESSYTGKAIPFKRLDYPMVDEEVMEAFRFFQQNKE